MLLYILLFLNDFYHYSLSNYVPWAGQFRVSQVIIYNITLKFDLRGNSYINRLTKLPRGALQFLKFIRLLHAPRKELLFCLCYYSDNRQQ